MLSTFAKQDQNGKIAGAGLDVYDEEPLPVDHPLRSLANTVLVPHAAGLTEDGLSVMYEAPWKTYWPFSTALQSES